MLRIMLLSIVVLASGCGQEEQPVPATPAAAPPAVPSSLPQAVAPPQSAPSATVPASFPAPLPATPMTAAAADSDDKTPSDNAARAGAKDRKSSAKKGKTGNGDGAASNLGTPDRIARVIANPPEDALKEPKGKLRQRPARRLSGELDPKKVNTVIRKTSARAEACAAVAFKAKPDTKGPLALNLTISPSGRVVKTETVKNEIGDVGEKCIRRILTALRFPKASGESMFQKAYTFVPGD